MDAIPYTQTIALLLDGSLTGTERREAYSMLVNNAEARELLAMCIKALSGNKEPVYGTYHSAEDRGPSENRGHSRSTEWAH